MTNESAIEILKDIHFTTYCMEQSIDTSKAIEMACDALKQIELIKKIIESAPNLQEDVIRYQMIVGILYGVNGPDNETSNN